MHRSPALLTLPLFSLPLFSLPLLARPLSAQRIEGPVPMKQAEVLHFTGAGAVWHTLSGGKVEVCGVPLAIERTTRGAMITLPGGAQQRVSKLPATPKVKLPKPAAVGSYTLRLRVTSVNGKDQLQVASAMAMHCTVKGGEAWIVDLDLDGKFLEKDEDALLHADSGTAGPFGGEVWFHRFGVRVAGTAQPTATLMRDAKDATGAAQCVLNHYRQVAGFAPVVYDKEWAKGCALHANYVKMNRHLRFNWHTEDAKNPHYTQAGADVAGRSLFALSGDYASGILANMDLVYHRRPLLDPSLGAIGCGGLEAVGGRRGSIGVIAIGHGAGKGAAGLQVGDGYPWPARGQTGVPTQFSGAELPMPLAKGVTPSGRGFPITYLFETGAARDARMEVFELRGKRERKLPGYTFGPGHEIADDGSTYAFSYRNNSGLCHFIAQRPMRTNTRHRAVCTYTVDGEKRVVTWEFTTGKGGVHLRR